MNDYYEQNFYSIYGNLTKNVKKKYFEVFTINLTIKMSIY